MKTVLFLFCLFPLVFSFPNGYGFKPERQSMHHLDQMINRCFQSICKEWMTECHWHCDSVSDKASHRHCMECLSKRGEHCLPCFEL